MVQWIFCRPFWRDHIRATVFLLAWTAAALPAHGQTQFEEEAERLANEAARSIMQALEFVMQAIPQYHAPEILDNGDIIIRRKNLDRDESDRDDPEGDDEDAETSDETNT